ncbi:hypothetical protein HYH02_014359 [Chlamydomonas schloesseri]|uniref:Uncharacterized protein n=1 Tax=Chlamydomonas schloesseri TaxID=2026947 RepID=A0A835SXZ3_9CHLO|nr:hypothetical protein HYH02_014359 [Chlamydomonas schloesseri]|eukprot:KAG2428555.1 hypothetical protein HYH02_014359 [Chlamydomonas schloesseri]
MTDMWLQSAAMLVPPPLAVAGSGLAGRGASSGCSGGGRGCWLLQLHLPVLLAALWLMRGASPLTAALLTAAWHTGLPVALLARLRLRLSAQAQAQVCVHTAGAPTAAAADAGQSRSDCRVSGAAGGGSGLGGRLQSPEQQLLWRRRPAVAIFADGSGLMDSHSHLHLHPHLQPHLQPHRHAHGNQQPHGQEHQHQHHHQGSQSPPPPPEGWLLQASSHAFDSAHPRPAASPDPRVVCGGGGAGSLHAPHTIAQRGAPQPDICAASGVGGRCSSAALGAWSSWLARSDDIKVLAAEVWLSLGPLVVGAVPVLPLSWWLSMAARAAAWVGARAALLGAALLGAVSMAVLAAPARGFRRPKEHNPQRGAKVAGDSGRRGDAPTHAAAAARASDAVTAGALRGVEATSVGAAAPHCAQPPSSPACAYAYPERLPPSQAASPAALATALALTAARAAVAAASPLASPQRQGPWAAPASAPCTPVRGHGGAAARRLQL